MDKKFTIAVFAGTLNTTYHLEILNGINDRANDLGINLLVMAGGDIHFENGERPQFTKIYEFINPDNCDGIISLSACIGFLCDPEQISGYLQKFFPLPVVSIAELLEDIPSVTLDNTSGLKTLLTHLIKEHGYRRLAFICGPKQSLDAQERLETYKQVLKEHSIPIDPRYILPGDFIYESGSAAVKIMLDERDVNAQAIVAANDYMAWGAIDELLKRGKKIPEDMAVIGFDNLQIAQERANILSSVKQPAYEMGAKAVNLLFSKIQNQAVPDNVLIPSEMVIRQSCGCHARLDNKMEGNISGHFIENITSQFQSVAMLFEGSSEVVTIDNLIDFLVTAFPKLGILSFYYLVYQDKQDITSESPMNLIFAYTNNRVINTYRDNIIFPANRILPEEYFPKDRPFSIIAHPMYFGGSNVGVVYHEMVSSKVYYTNILQRIFMNTVLRAAILTHKVLDQSRVLKEVNKDLSLLVTELKNTQDNLVQAAKLASLGEMSAGIAHELKNPMNFVNNFAKLNLEDVNKLMILFKEYRNQPNESLGEKISQTIEELLENSIEIFMNGDRAGQIIKSMLNQARGDTNTTDDCNINHVLSEASTLAYHSIRTLMPGFNVKMEFNPDESLPLIKANFSQISTVFRNILSNAFYAMEERAKMEPGYTPSLTTSTTFKDNNIVIAIEDNGTGIKEEVKSRIFDPFFTTKPPGKGTGIGLKACYEIIVDGMGGTINCSSVWGAGTLFTIILPVK